MAEAERLVMGTESRRERVYSRRKELVGRVCEEQEEQITLHTVKMYDLVPPAPIGRLPTRLTIFLHLKAILVLTKV